MPKLQKFLGLLFKYVKLFVYVIMVVMFGIPLAVFWGLLMGLATFFRSWVAYPLTKLIMYIVGMAIPAVIQPLRAVLMPLADVAAYPFRHIKIKHDLNGGLLLPLAAQNQQGALGNEAP
jgi:hypothetical protein